jgi:hypothetical protein
MIIPVQRFHNRNMFLLWCKFCYLKINSVHSSHAAQQHSIQNRLDFTPAHLHSTCVAAVKHQGRGGGAVVRMSARAEVESEKSRVDIIHLQRSRTQKTLAKLMAGKSWQERTGRKAKSWCAPREQPQSRWRKQASWRKEGSWRKSSKGARAAEAQEQLIGKLSNLVSTWMVRERGLGGRRARGARAA